jgi:hypothetical protein
MTERAMEHTLVPDLLRLGAVSSVVQNERVTGGRG